MLKKILVGFLALVMFIINCNAFKKDNEDKNKNRNLLAALAIANSSQSLGLLCNSSFEGFACIPDSLTSSSSNTKALKQSVVGDSKYADLPKIYQPVRDALKLNRNILESIAKLVVELRKVGDVNTTLQGTSTWNDQPAKYRYRKSTLRNGGKHLEVWYNGAIAPYLNQKAIEIDFKDGGVNGEVEGQIWVLSKNSNNTTYKAHVTFRYDGQTKKRSSAVILNGFLSDRNEIENAHFFVNEENGISTIDGGISLNNFTPGTVGNTTIPSAGRVYLFSAAGSTERAAINLALPLDTNTSTSVFNNEDVANISEVWTDWLLYGISSNLSTINFVCTGSNSLTPPSNPNPTTPEGSSAATLRSCFDKILLTQPNNEVKNFYYIANIKNPAFYSFSNSKAVLESIEKPNDSSWATVQVKLKNTVRSSDPGDGYYANFTAQAIRNLDLITGTGITSKEQWGNGSGGKNTTNDSAFDSPDF